MFCLHRYNKWKTYTMRYIVIDKRSGTAHNTYAKHQERTCAKCGKTQDREI